MIEQIFSTSKYLPIPKADLRRYHNIFNEEDRPFIESILFSLRSSGKFDSYIVQKENNTNYQPEILAVEITPHTKQYLVSTLHGRAGKIPGDQRQNWIRLGSAYIAPKGEIFYVDPLPPSEYYAGADLESRFLLSPAIWISRNEPRPIRLSIISKQDFEQLTQKSI